MVKEDHVCFECIDGRITLNGRFLKCKYITDKSYRFYCVFLACTIEKGMFANEYVDFVQITIRII